MEGEEGWIEEGAKGRRDRAEEGCGGIRRAEEGRGGEEGSWTNRD